MIKYLLTLNYCVNAIRQEPATRIDTFTQVLFQPGKGYRMRWRRFIAHKIDKKRYLVVDTETPISTEPICRLKVGLLVSFLLTGGISSEKVKSHRGAAG